MVGNSRFGVLDESAHSTVLSAADANTFLNSHQFMSAGVGSRLGVCNINGVVFRYEDAAGTAELMPLIEKLSILIENLNAIVLAITDKQAAARIHRDRVRFADLS